MSKLSLWVVALVALPLNLAAQVATADTALVRVLTESVHARDHLRITADRTIEGRITRLSDDDAHVIGGRVPLRDITQVERRTRSGGGALVGGIAGAAAGAIATVFTIGRIAGGPDSAAGLLPIAALGAAVGGLLGALIGLNADPPDENWQTLWAR